MHMNIYEYILGEGRNAGQKHYGMRITEFRHPYQKLTLFFFIRSRLFRAAWICFTKRTLGKGDCEMILTHREKFKIFFVKLPETFLKYVKKSDLTRDT